MKPHVRAAAAAHGTISATCKTIHFELIDIIKATVFMIINHNVGWPKFKRELSNEHQRNMWPSFIILCRRIANDVWWKKSLRETLSTLIAEEPVFMGAEREVLQFDDVVDWFGIVKSISIDWSEHDQVHVLPWVTSRKDGRNPGILATQSNQSATSPLHQKHSHYDSDATSTTGHHRSTSNQRNIRRQFIYFG